MLKVKFKYRPGHIDGAVLQPPWRLRTVFLNLTERCNLNCRYCHSYSDRLEMMPVEEVEKLVRAMADFGRPALVLTGGEPLLYPHLTKVLQLCRTYGIASKIATNGTLLTERMVETLVQEGVGSLQISLDTLQPRRYAAVKESQEEIHGAVMEGIRRVVATGRLHTVVSTVAEETTLDEIGTMLRFCHDQGVHTFTVYDLIPYGRAARRPGLRLPPEKFEGLIEEGVEAFSALPQHWLVELGLPWAIKASRIYRRVSSRVPVNGLGCIAGKSSLTIQVNGDAIPCVCLGNHAFWAGNIIAGDRLPDIWNAPTMRYFRNEAPLEGCQRCGHKDQCLGGCRALAYLHSRRRDGPDPVCQVWLGQEAVWTPAG